MKTEAPGSSHQCDDFFFLYVARTLAYPGDKADDIRSAYTDARSSRSDSLSLSLAAVATEI